MSNVSNTILERVLEALPTAGGLSYQDIHARVGMWSLITIKHAVRQLKEKGLVIRGGTHQKPEFRRIGEALK
jgi:transposase